MKLRTSPSVYAVQEIRESARRSAKLNTPASSQVQNEASSSTSIQETPQLLLPPTSRLEIQPGIGRPSSNNQLNPSLPRAMCSFSANSNTHVREKQFQGQLNNRISSKKNRIKTIVGMPQPRRSRQAR